MPLAACVDRQLPFELDFVLRQTRNIRGQCPCLQRDKAYFAIRSQQSFFIKPVAVDQRNERDHDYAVADVQFTTLTSSTPTPSNLPPRQPRCNSSTPHAEDQDHPAALWTCVLWHFFASHSCCSTWQNLPLKEYPTCSKQMVAGMKISPRRNSSDGTGEHTPFIFYPVTPNSKWRCLP